MNIKIISPTKAILTSYAQEELESLVKELTYTNLSVQHQLKRLSKNHWFKNNNPEKYKEQCEILKESLHNTLIFKDDNTVYIRPGSIPYLKGASIQVEDLIEYPKPKKIPWKAPLPFKLYPYQEESIQKLLEVKHGNVNICTGGGKTSVILSICRELGLQTVIVTPSSSIFNEILESAEKHFGKNKVGGYGDGKKKIGKLITVTVSKSLTNLCPGTPEYDFFKKTQVFIGDENQTLPSDTLEEVCHGILSEAPYRFFFSGSPTRADGSVKLLESIIGETVLTLTTKEAVEKGFVSPHNFKIVKVFTSEPNVTTGDPLETKRVHFLRNKNICNFIAKLCNALASKGQQTLVLVEELNQIAMLYPKIETTVAIAHSEKELQKLQELGLYKVKPNESVEKFNKKEAMVLIGTSCISTGTNIYPMTHTVNWQGGASEVKTKQGAVGRSVRLPKSNPYMNLCGPKESVTIWDFSVIGNYTLERHLQERIEYYKDSGENLITHIKLG